MSVIEKKFKDHIQFLNPQEKDTGKILYNLLVNEYKRRIAHYQNIDRIFRKKYAMSYSDFTKKNIVKKENFPGMSNQTQWIGNRLLMVSKP